MTKTSLGLVSGVSGAVVETAPRIAVNTDNPTPGLVREPETYAGGSVSFPASADGSMSPSAAGAADAVTNMVQATPTRSDAYRGTHTAGGRIASFYQEDPRATRRTGTAENYRAMGVVLGTNAYGLTDCRARIKRIINRVSIREDMGVYDYAPKGYARIEQDGTIGLNASAQAGQASVGVTRNWNVYRGERDAAHTQLESGREGTITAWIGDRPPDRTANTDNVLIAEHPRDAGWTIHYSWTAYYGNSRC